MIKCERNCENDKCGLNCTCVDSSQVRYKENGAWKTTDKGYKTIEHFGEMLKQNGITNVTQYYMVKG